MTSPPVKMQLWDNTPGMCAEIPKITYYASADKPTPPSSFSGGGYGGRANHEARATPDF